MSDAQIFLSVDLQNQLKNTGNGRKNKPMVESLLDEYRREVVDGEILADEDDYAVICENRIGKKYRVNLHKNGEYNVVDCNQRFRVFDNLGIKYGDYVEILFDFSEDLFQQLSENDDFDLYEFEIGTVKATIAHPSLLYDLALKEFDGDKYYFWPDYWTLSLKGVTGENYEEYITKALFTIRWFNEPIYCEWNPKCYEYYGYYDALCIDSDERESLMSNRRQEYNKYDGYSFSDFNHYEALAFYNEGMLLLENEIAFHYFYKVLEYFFLICRQSEFESLIADYNSVKNIDSFIAGVTKIYQQNEEAQLTILLKSIEPDISSNVSSAFQEGIINSNNIEEFASSLYLYRNKIVHGKSDTKFELKLPTIVKSKEEKFWEKCIVRIAEILIKKYCFLP